MIRCGPHLANNFPPGPRKTALRIRCCFGQVPPCKSGATANQPSEWYQESLGGYYSLDCVVQLSFLDHRLVHQWTYVKLRAPALGSSSTAVVEVLGGCHQCPLCASAVDYSSTRAFGVFFSTHRTQLQQCSSSRGVEAYFQYPLCAAAQQYSRLLRHLFGIRYVQQL